MRQGTTHRGRALVPATLLALLVTAGCTSGGDAPDDGERHDYRTVTIAVPKWAGARANVAVAEKLLEEEIGVRVEAREMDSEDAWDGMNDGSVHAALEDWRGQREREERYVTERRTVVEGGDLGVTGHIGWFVPRYYADENPEITDYRNLNKYADDFRVPGSGGKGAFIGADPSFTNSDEILVKNLELDFEVMPTKGEDGLVKAIKSRYAAKEPFLTYWYEPHWRNLELDLVEVDLPDYAEGCNVPEEFTDCAYPIVPIQKYFNADFEQHGGDAAEFLKNFRWSTRQQNEVAKLIEGDGLSPSEAAAEWIGDNPTVWQRWLPEQR
ncbi:glycine betaine ABC transporter substrate-binding protein [Streptomyces sparsus]